MWENVWKMSSLCKCKVRACKEMPHTVWGTGTVQSSADKREAMAHHLIALLQPLPPQLTTIYYGKSSLLVCSTIKSHPPLDKMLESQFDQILLIHWFPPFTHSELKWIFRKKSPNNVWNSIHQQIPVISFLINWTSTREWMEKRGKCVFRLGFLPFLMYSALRYYRWGIMWMTIQEWISFCVNFLIFFRFTGNFIPLNRMKMWKMKNANGCDWSEIDLLAICMSASGLKVKWNVSVWDILADVL